MNFLRPLSAGAALVFSLAWQASAQVSVTTWQADNSHTGNNSKETLLTPGTVSSPGNFGLLFTRPLDGQTYGQPLVAAGVSIGGTTHNVVYVATQRCKLYAFDGDNNTGANANALWQISLLPAGCVPVPQSVVGSSDIYDTLGITTTPVIDLASSTIYIVSKVQRTSDTSYHQYLYALDLATGAYKFNSPVEINPTFPGKGSDAVNNQIPFNALRSHLRCAMALNNGLLYLAYASHSDSTPYHGDVLAYNATTLQLAKQFTASPLASYNGIWSSGASPAIDAAGNVFVATGNGDWGDPQKSSLTTFPDASYPYGTNWAHSILKLPPDTFNVKVSNPLNWFTPTYWSNLNNGDLDLGCGGITLLPDQSGPHTHIMVEGGKGGLLYVVDRDNLGGGGTGGTESSIQEISEPGGKAFFCTPAYYNGAIYYSASGGPLTQRTVAYNAADGSYVQASNPTISSEVYSNNKGSGCFISSNGNTNGIVWILKGSGMRGYNAANVSAKPIFDGNAQVSGSNYTYQTPKFALPTAVNGKVYYCAFNPDTFAGQLFVYGILPTATGSPASPSDASAVANASDTITLGWTDNSSNESGFKISRSTNATSGFVQIATAGANITAYTDTGLNPATTYYYQVAATNSVGDSRATNVASATTFPSYAENGLIAYWNLDQTNSTTIPDVTGNGHTGTLHGETTSGATGYVNLSVNFHGTGQSPSDIIVANKADLQYSVTGSFTWAGWVQAEALRGDPDLGAGNGIEETIFAKSRNTGNYYGVWINTADKWVFRGPNADIVGPLAKAGVWTHVAVVQDGAAGTRKLYINGALGGTGSAQPADGSGDLYMARQNVTGNIEGFPGSLDEVRFYNRALSQGELTNLMGPPVLGGQSVQTHGASGSFAETIWPLTAVKAIESRKGTTTGSYKVALSFAAPVANSIAAALGTQGGGSPTGSVQGVSYDATGKVVTVSLTGVGNAQALNLHLSGITPSNSSPVSNGTADIPFNVLWGDVNNDNVGNNLDYSIVLNSHATLITSANYQYDLNCDGKIDAADDAIANAASGTALGAQTDTNLAIFQTAKALSDNGTGVAAQYAFDNSLSTRWESTQKVDPQWIYVDLGSVCTVHKVLIYWENSGGKDYTIQASTTDTNDGSFTPFVTVTGNTTTNSYLTYAGLNVQARYVRVYGTARTSGTGTNGYGYSMYDCQVIGLSGAVAPTVAPTINSATSATGTVNVAFNYQITASNSPTSYSAANLPAGLSFSAATGLISGTPTQAGSYTISLGATNSVGTGTASLALTVQTPFAAWQGQYFTADELSNSAVSGPNATPAGDGITNLMKYALNLNPKTSGSAGMPTVSVTTAGGSQYLTLTYTRNLAATDLTYVPEVSGDLQSWLSGASNLTSVSSTNNADGKTQTVVVRDNTTTTGTAKRFIHLKVTTP